MGRRSARHAFMPSVYVFPGGAVDRTDGRNDTPGPIPPEDVAKLVAGLGARATPRRANALVQAALRETREETGIDVASASIGPLRYVARAITPPGRTRRFDARFFCAQLSDASIGFEATDELEDVRWVPLDGSDLPFATITRAILRELAERLRLDPTLRADPPLPLYRAVRGTVVRSEF